MKNSFSLILLSVLIITSCGKVAHKVDQNYVGQWTATEGNTYFSIFIHSDSEAEFYKGYGNGNENEYRVGKARITKKNLTIGIVVFKLDQTPVFNTNTSEYSMILDGIVYTKS